MADLLPCPFCGANAHAHQRANFAKISWQVQCAECYCGTPTGFETPEYAAVAWNKRAALTRAVPPAADGGAVERVLNAVEKLADAAFIHGMHYQGNERCVEQRAARVTALAAVTDALSALAHPAPAADGGAVRDHMVACLRDRDDKLCSDAADEIERLAALLRRLAAERGAK
jgi:hypothetical protein